MASNDRTIPPAVECDTANRMNATTRTLPTSHVAMLAGIDAVVGFLPDAVAALSSN